MKIQILRTVAIALTLSFFANAAATTVLPTIMRPIPVQQLDCENGHITLQWADYSGIIAWRLYQTTDLASGEWTPIDDTEIALQPLPGGDPTIFPANATQVTLPMLQDQRFFHLQALKIEDVGGVHAIPGLDSYAVTFDTDALNTALTEAEEFPVTATSPVHYAYTVPGSLIYGNLQELTLPQYWLFFGWTNAISDELIKPTDQINSSHTLYPSWMQTDPDGWNGVDHTIMINLTNNYAIIRLPPDFNVTNDTASATHHLYLRHILPGGACIGSPAGETGVATAVQSNITVPGFYMGVFEITDYQYNRINNTSSNPSPITTPISSRDWNTIRGKTGTGANPTAVSEPPAGWLKKLEDAVALGNNNLTLSFDLPTEAQWEFACRAGTTGTFNDSDLLETTSIIDSAGLARADLLAWSLDNSGGVKHIVGQKAPNAAGLYDMHGNVWEICRDARDNSSTLLPTGSNPLTTAGSNRTIRGGGFNIGAINCRSAFRSSVGPGSGQNHIGFRIAAYGIVKP